MSLYFAVVLVNVLKSVFSGNFVLKFPSDVNKQARCVKTMFCFNCVSCVR